MILHKFRCLRPSCGRPWTVYATEEITGGVPPCRFCGSKLVRRVK